MWNDATLCITPKMHKVKQWFLFIKLHHIIQSATCIATKNKHYIHTREEKTTQSIEKKVSVTPSCRLVISIRLCRTWFVEPQTYRMRYSSKNMCVSGVWSCKREEINHKVMLITTNYGQSNRIEHKTTRDHIIFGTKYALCREIRSISFM